MKKIALFFAATLLILSSCSKVEDPISQNRAPAPLNTVKVGEVIDGVPTLILDKAELACAYREVYNAEETTDIHLTRENGTFYLWSFLQTRSTRITMATSLSANDGKNLYLTRNGTTQTCSSDASCSGCALTITDISSGYCGCINTTSESGDASCAHDVTQVVEDKEIQEGNAQLEAIIAHLNS